MSRQPNLLAFFAVAASRAMTTCVQAAPAGVKAKAKKQSLI